MPTNLLTIEVGNVIEITSTTVNDAGAPVAPTTIKFYLEGPDGVDSSGDSPDANPSTGVYVKYYTLTQRGTYGITVRTTAPDTAVSGHVTTEWSAA